MFIGIGKKKTSKAKVFLSLKKNYNNIIINKKKVFNYFNKKMNYKLILKPLYILNLKKFKIKINVRGGGKSSQIFAITEGISKALLKYNNKFKKILSDNKLISRDSRIVERKKIGKHKSRKSKQFSKR